MDFKKSCNFASAKPGGELALEANYNARRITHVVSIGTMINRSKAIEQTP